MEDLFGLLSSTPRSSGPLMRGLQHPVYRGGGTRCDVVVNVSPLGIPVFYLSSRLFYVGSQALQLDLLCLWANEPWILVVWGHGLHGPDSELPGGCWEVGGVMGSDGYYGASPVPGLCLLAIIRDGHRTDGLC